MFSFIGNYFWSVQFLRQRALAAQCVAVGCAMLLLVYFGRMARFCTAVLLAAEACCAGCRQTVAGSTAPHDCPMRWQLHQQGRSPPFNPSACTWPCCACRTHYFYRLLGASYTFPAHNLNQARPACLECHESAAQRLDPARSS